MSLQNCPIPREDPGLQLITTCKGHLYFALYNSLQTDLNSRGGIGWGLRRPSLIGYKHSGAKVSQYHQVPKLVSIIWRGRK